MYLLCLVAALLILHPLAARSQEGEEWAAYTSMGNIGDLLVHENAVWSLTTGGLLRFDRQTETYSRFTRVDGLAGNQVSSAAIDANGHLWFGTNRQGLSRYRPETDSFDPPFLDFEDLDIASLLADGNRLFVGTGRGISTFLIDKEEVKETYRQLGGMPKDTEVEAMLLFAGKLWAGTTKGIAWADLNLPNLQDPDSWESGSIGRVTDLLVFADTLFCTSHRGVYRFEQDENRFRLDLPSQDIIDLEIFKGNIIALSREGTLFQRRGRVDWTDDVAPRISGAHAISLIDSALWVATESGLRVVGGDAPPPSREPTASRFFDLGMTADGHLWSATVPKDNIIPFGLYQFDGEGWTVHNLKTGLSSEYVTSVESDSLDRVWIGNWGRGVDVLDTTGTVRRLNHANSVLRGIGVSESYVAISDIARDPQGLMWISNVQIGLAVMDGYPARNSFMYENRHLGLAPGRNTNQIAIGADGLKWLSTALDGFLLFDDGGTPFTEGDEYAQLFSTFSESRLTSDRTSDILVDRFGAIWVGTDNGLNVVRGTYARDPGDFGVEEWRVYNTANGLPANAITALAEDARGNIWVGTEAGLAQITTAGDVAFALTSANSGLIADQINSLLFDPVEGALWIGTMDGLSRLRVEGGKRANGPVWQVFPNPFEIGHLSAELTFAGLPLGAGLDIFTIDGHLVRRIEGTPGQGTILWNGQNEAGFLVGSGIYIFVAQGETGAPTRGRFAVVNTR